MDCDAPDQKYVDLLAQALQVVNSASAEELYRLSAAVKDKEVGERVNEEIHKAESLTVEELLTTIQRLLDEMHQADEDKRLSYAVAISYHMDHRICYEDASDPFCMWEGGRMHLHALVPIQSDKCPAIVTALNENWEDTGICISPKFPVSHAVDSCTEPRELAAPNSLHGINNTLINISYYPWNKNTPDVRHIIVPERPPTEGGEILPQRTRIVFFPITDRSDLLKKRYVDYEVGGTTYNGVAVDGIIDPSSVESSFRESWLACCEESPDIAFGPEMLATDDMVKIQNSGSVYLKSLLKEAAKAGLKPPRVTIMPTHWKNGFNRLCVFDETGRHLGTQFKRKPYIDKRSRRIEALCPLTEETNDVLMIHMKNQQRIAVVICAEFLFDTEHVEHFLCSQLGATLILVPSYSPGEQGFMTMLSKLHRYGVSVIWGNCCGAVSAVSSEDGRIMGGCSYAGSDLQKRFGDVSNCGYRCHEGKTCFFVVDIPTEVVWQKPNSTSMPEIFQVHT